MTAFGARVQLKDRETGEPVTRLIVVVADSPNGARHQSGLPSEAFEPVDEKALREWKRMTGESLTGREYETLARLVRRTLEQIANKAAREAAFGPRRSGGRAQVYAEIDRWRAVDLTVLLGKLESMREEEEDAA